MPVLTSAMDFGRQIQQGIVTSVDPALRTYTVSIGANRSAITSLSDCVWVSEAFGGLLGFKVDGLLSLGSPVMVIPGSPNMIVKALPFSPFDFNYSNFRKAVGGDDAPSYYEQSAASTVASGISNYPYTDLMEGEFVLSNYIGVFAAFLTNLVKIGASEAAKIECLLFDDMVRIVSRTFRHHSCMGDLEVFDDGAPSSIEDYTSRRHEALGLLNQNEVEGTGGVPDFDASSATLRARFSRYTGWLGGFIHEIVTSPADALGNLAQQRAGKSRFWRGEDGSVLMQGTGDIAIEYVRKIVVPVRKKLPEDPTGNTNQEVPLPGDLQALWDYGPDFKDAAECAFQLREYARWLNQAFCMARFQALSKDWEVKSESASPTPDYSDADEELKTLRATNLNPPGKYACIRIFRGSGALMLVSGDGWSISSYDGDVYFDGPKNMHFRSAGDMHFVSGGSISHTARKNVETFATYGGIKSRSRTCMDLLCEDGGIHIKTDAVADPEQAPDNEIHDDLTPPEVRSHGIVLESTKSKVAISAKAGLELENSGPQEALTIKSSGRIDVASGAPMAVNCTGDIDFSNLGFDFKVKTKSMYLDPASKVQLKRNGLVIENGIVKVNKLEANSTIKSKAGITTRRADIGNLITNSTATRSGKVGKNDAGASISDSPGKPLHGIASPILSNDAEIEYEKSPAIYLEEVDKRLPVWNMFTKVSWTRKNERLMRTYTQERLEEDLSEDESLLYEGWDLEEAKLLKRHSRTGTAESCSWGSWMKQSKSNSPMAALSQDASQSGEELLDKTPFTEGNIVFKYLKPKP